MHNNDQEDVSPYVSRNGKEYFCMKVALYARVSTQRQEKQGTIASQIAALCKYAHENNYLIADQYVCKDGPVFSLAQLRKMPPEY